MPKHRTRSRKERRLDARWLITGTATPRILHHGQTAYLQPVRAGDHPRRYNPGQRLALKPYVPGPTEAHVVVTAADRVPLSDVSNAIARELGYTDRDDFRLAWVQNEDADWLERHNDTPLIIDAMLSRFEHRWTNKLAWLIRFRIDNTAEPRLLAARSDELYVTNEAMALHNEMPALTEQEWATHIGPGSFYRRHERLRAQRQAREAQDLTARLNQAKTAAKAKGYDIRSETRQLERIIERGDATKARQQITLIERRVFPIAA